MIPVAQLFSIAERISHSQAANISICRQATPLRDRVALMKSAIEKMRIYWQGFPPYLKWAIGLPGTLFLGSLPNGIWESLTKPAIGALFTWSLNITTLGLSTLRDDLYARAAGDPLADTIIFLAIVCMGAIGTVQGIVFSMSLRLARKLRKSTTEDCDDGQIKQNTPKAPNRRVITANAYLGLVAAIGLVFLANTRIYALRVSSHFHRVETICAPYISAEERTKLRSDFARMKTKSEFVSILSRMEEIAKEQNVKLPELAVF